MCLARAARLSFYKVLRQVVLIFPKTGDTSTRLVFFNNLRTSNISLSSHYPTELRYFEIPMYDKMLFMASGIGTEAHLLPIRHLLLAYDNETTRIRRLALVCSLKTNVESITCTFLLYHLRLTCTRSVHLGREILARFPRDARLPG